MAGSAFAYPLRVRDGQFVHVEQGGPEHVEVQAEVVLRTERGDIEALPDVGRPELLGGMGPVGPRLLDALAAHVPAIEFLADEQRSALSRRAHDLYIARVG